MEHHKRHIQRPLQKKHKQKQKHEFFQQVFKQCKQSFPPTQYQFFIKCIIPHCNINNQPTGLYRKSRNSTTNQKQTNINQINPNIFTMPRKMNFYEQKNIDNVKLEKVNRRLLTTPTQKIKGQISFNNYQDFQFYKKMKQCQENFYDKSSQNVNLNSKLKFNHSNTKIYMPQTLFYPNMQKREVPKIRLNMTSKNKRNKCNKKDYFKEINSTNQKTNSQFLPQNFVQLLKPPKNNLTTYRNIRTGCPRAGYHRSMKSMR